MKNMNIKPSGLFLFFLVASLLISVGFEMSKAAQPNQVVPFEYATIRWGGRENTCVIRPDGRIDFPKKALSAKLPARVDERSFYMNLVLNGLSKEGYELVSMTNDEMVLKRPAFIP